MKIFTLTNFYQTFLILLLKIFLFTYKSWINIHQVIEQKGNY